MTAALLLDAHALIWFVEGDSGRIGTALRQRIEGAATSVSVASRPDRLELK